MTRAEHLAAWIVQATYEDLSEEARQALKIRVLDALGCAIDVLDGPPIRMLRAQLEDFGGTPLVTLIGGGKTAPDRAALYNCAPSTEKDLCQAIVEAVAHLEMIEIGELAGLLARVNRKEQR
jgi:2-methylcitrate dehydratase PrpD